MRQRSVSGLVRAMQSPHTTEEERLECATQFVKIAIEAEVDFRLNNEEISIGYPSISPTAALGGVPGGGDGGYNNLDWECDHMRSRGQLEELGKRMLDQLPLRARAAVMLCAYPTLSPKAMQSELRRVLAPRDITLDEVVKHQYHIAEQLGIIKHRLPVITRYDSSIVLRSIRPNSCSLRYTPIGADGRLDLTTVTMMFKGKKAMGLPFDKFPSAGALKYAAHAARGALSKKIYKMYASQ